MSHVDRGRRLNHDPGGTDEGKLRISVGIVVPRETEVSGEVSRMTL